MKKKSRNGEKVPFNRRHKVEMLRKFHISGSLIQQKRKSFQVVSLKFYIRY